MDPAAPLILTLRFDERSFTFLDGQRRRHFPPERNVIPAHLTLFHHLPGEQLAPLEEHIAARCSCQHPFALDVTGLRSLGRGVAYTLASADLAALRRDLAHRWAEWLKPQDRQKHQPHVTIQNKVDPQEAGTLLAQLSETFQPFQVIGIGLDLWWYRRGPWEKAAFFPFKGAR